MLLKKVIRPALERAGIRGKTVGWHTFQHSLGTNLRFLGVDIKVAQELLRHANAKITLDLYTQAISSQKREANAMVVEMMLPAGRNAEEPEHHSAPPGKEKWEQFRTFLEEGFEICCQFAAKHQGRGAAKCLINMVGTTGFEPATSSVSRKRSNQLSYAPVKHLKPVYQDRRGRERQSC